MMPNPPTAPSRFLDRLRPPVVPSEAQRVERVLAAARVFLASTSLVAIYVDPTQPSRYATLAYSLLSIYVIHSLLILILVGVRPDSTTAFRFSVHAVDVFWPALISLFTEGPNSPFFLLFVFVLLAAAYRWGFFETLATAGAGIVLLFFEALFLGPTQTAPGRFLEGQYDLNHFIMRATYLLILGYVLGYLGEEEEQLRAETSAIARIVGKAPAEAGLRRALQAVLEEILQLFGGSRVLLPLEETTTGRAYLWEIQRPHGTEVSTLHFTELGAGQRDKYFFTSPGDAWHASRRRRLWGGERIAWFGLNREGQRLPKSPWSFPQNFVAAHPFRALIAACFSFGEEWSGRLFVFDPPLGGAGEAKLRLLQTLIREAGPAVYSVYLLRRLRARAGAVERARVARELHDGVIQSLIGAEMQVDVLRRQAAGNPARTAEELTRIQQLLRQEVLNLRELMQQMKPLDLGPKQLLDFLADSVEKFRRETGISASFVSELAELALPPRVSREVARIVQEALANVRKHSGARNVVVRFASQNGNWMLVIDDDGRGFEFSGRLSQAELDAARKGPVVIKERVRSIGGELAVESTPGRGARLEIRFAQKARG